MDKDRPIQWSAHYLIKSMREPYASDTVITVYGNLDTRVGTNIGMNKNYTFKK